MRKTLLRLLLGKNYVLKSKFFKYRKLMKELLERKDRQIAELTQEKEALMKTAMKQSEKNYELQQQFNRYKAEK